jgi:hypothetical protein
MTQISIKTKSYARNKSYNAIVDALLAEGYGFKTHLGTFESDFDGVTLTTNAPRNFVERIEFTRSAVQIRG